MANATRTTADDDNPFLVSSPTARQLHKRLSDNQSDATSTSEASAICPAQQNDAQDVKAFFREENG
jgi:hypothetical protein